MRHTIFYRVSGCVNAAGEPTSVCLKQDLLPELERLAYGGRATVNSAIRAASRIVALTSGSWSKTVVARARAQLAGNYQPARAAALEALALDELEGDIEAALQASSTGTADRAAENNAVWAAAL